MSEANTGGSEALRGRLASLLVLTPLPATVDALLRVADAPMADAPLGESPFSEAIAACARRDPALLAYLLKGREGLASPDVLANSVSLSTLLADLAPALAAQLIGDLHAYDGGEQDAYATMVWPRSIRTACLAEALARAAHATDETAERAYALGLLLDTGAAALYRLEPATYSPMLREHGVQLPDLLEAERASFGMTHSLAGRIWADAWELPAEARRHIWLQYQPRPAHAATDTERTLTLVLHWARRFAWGAQLSQAEVTALDLAVPAEEIRAAIESAEDRAAAMMQSAPATALEPESFRTRLSAFISAPSRSTTAEELAWAEQALMAGEGQAVPAAADASSAGRSDAIAAMAKALHSPIARITAGTNTLLTTSGEADPGLLRAIHEQGQLAERILQDVLAHTQPVAPKPEPQLLNFFLRRFFQGIEERMRWRGVRIELNLAEGLPRIPLDRMAFEQVLLNLTANAAQSMGELGGVLTVATESAGNEGVVVRVEDTGRGLGAGLVQQAFEPFVKGPDSGEGPGLGLTAAKALVEAHGGRIELTPGAERGAVCTMTLPLTVQTTPGVVKKPTQAKQPTPAKNPAPSKPIEAKVPEIKSPEIKERPLLRVVDVQSKAAQPSSPQSKSLPPKSLPPKPSPPKPSPPKTPEPAAETPKATPQDLDPKQLLMADPDFELGELLHELLGRRGFDVVYLRDPAQALAEATGAAFGQILVDAALTAPDGRPLAQALHEALPGARVILTITPGAPFAGAIEGVSTLRLEKPFPVRALLSALQPAGSASRK